MIHYDEDELLEIKSEPDDPDADIFRQAVPSQYNSVLYDKLKKEKKLDRFLEVLRICSLKNMSMAATCKQLTLMFPSYCRGSGFSVNTLDKMRIRYKDIEEAMSFTKDTALLAAFERAAKLAKAAEKIDDTMVFIDRFDNDGLLGPAPVKADTKGNAVNVNVNNYSKETKATDELIYHSYLQNLGEDRSVNKDGATEQATTDND